MSTHRRALRKRKRRYKELERKERTNGKKEIGGSEVKEGQPEEKKAKRGRSENKKRKWRRKKPISNISAHKTDMT